MFLPLHAFTGGVTVYFALSSVIFQGAPWNPSWKGFAQAGQLKQGSYGTAVL